MLIILHKAGSNFNRESNAFRMAAYFMRMICDNLKILRF